MRVKTFVVCLFLVSIIVAAVAATNMMAKKTTASGPKEYVLAATMPLPAGTLLRAEDVSWQGVIETGPDQIVHPSAAALEAKPGLDDEIRTSVYGAVLRHPLAAGEPIGKSVIVKPGDRDFLQVVLTPGERAIAIPVATGGASTGLLSPGDRVDVILTQNFAKDNQSQELKNTPITRRSVGETIVENLRVLAIDAPDTKTTSAAANPANGNFGRTVTLEVTPDEAEQINVATELGKLSLTLRGVGTPVGSTRLTTAAPPDALVEQRVKPKWAGDVSPALYGAAQEKPVALTPPTVMVFHGAGKETGNSSVRVETVKTDN
jgi:pilus assembly protein CpaB